jgi:hypothetical protein
MSGAGATPTGGTSVAGDESYQYKAKALYACGCLGLLRIEN